jgi:hypothetical protein
MRVTLKNESVKFTRKRTILRAVLLILLIALIPAAYYLPRLLIRGETAEVYCRKVFPIISIVPTSLNGLFMTSLTEMFVCVGSVSLLVLFILFIARSVSIAYRAGIRRMLYHIYVVLRTVAIIGIVAALIFELMHGINYNRESIRKQMHLYGDTRPYEDYEEALGWAYAGMVEARSSLGEDYRGVAHMRSSFETTVYDANLAVTAFSTTYDLGLSLNYVRAKPVMLSHLWRYTDIVGFYDAFLGEANVNTDYLDILHFPVTVCHELCHAKGYASETDANTIAVLSCIHSERADFRYAGYYYIFMRLWSEAGEYARHEGESLPDFASLESFAPVLRDMRAYYRYLDTFEEGPIADLIARFSEDANNAFLESNGQEGGTDTYVVPQDAYVEYYCRYIRGDA